MSRKLKMFLAVMFLGGVGFNAATQTIDLNSTYLNMNVSYLTYFTSYMLVVDGAYVHLRPSSYVDFYTSYNPKTTYHYGNLNLTGNLNGLPPKSFIHPHPTEDSKVIRYIAIESAEALTLARGTAKTNGGEAVIALPEHFSMVTSKDEPITVNLTPEGAPVLLYVKEKSREQIVIAMKKADYSEFRDVEFSFQVTGVRDGYEKVETIISLDDLEKTTPARADVQKKIDALSKKINEKAEAKAGIKDKETGVKDEK